MSTEEFNPYSAPIAQSERVKREKPRLFGATYGLVLIAVIFYHLMVLVFMASPPDFRVSLVFLLTSPLLLAWLIRMNFGVSSALFGYLSAIAQLITEGALFWEVVFLNGLYRIAVLRS